MFYIELDAEIRSSSSEDFIDIENPPVSYVSPSSPGLINRSVFEMIDLSDPDLPSLNILVVDDSMVNRKMMVRALGSINATLHQVVGKFICNQSILF